MSSPQDSPTKKIVCARYLYDGCKSMDDMVKALRDEVTYLLDMKAKGWQLETTIANDRGVLVNAASDAEDAWWSVIDDQYFESKK